MITKSFVLENQGINTSKFQNNYVPEKILTQQHQYNKHKWKEKIMSDHQQHYNAEQQQRQLNQRQQLSLPQNFNGEEETLRPLQIDDDDDEMNFFNTSYHRPQQQQQLLLQVPQSTAMFPSSSSVSGIQQQLLQQQQQVQRPITTTTITTNAGANNSSASLSSTQSSLASASQRSHNTTTTNDNNNKNKDSSSSEVLFPSKLYQMLHEAEILGFTNVVSWGNAPNAFCVHRKSDFEAQILPKYFKMTKYKSFTRQLHNYEFSWLRNGPDKGGCKFFSYVICCFVLFCFVSSLRTPR
jgi:hypothetical protein